jgi:ubiquinone/menaquinone biosynthesis C-methylase UbiE
LLETQSIVPEDLYEALADRYDRFHGTFESHDSRHDGFFADLFSRAGVRSVLDCACGTGRHVHMLHSLGLDVQGSDRSAAMLAVACRNLEGAGIEVPLRQADYRDLPAHFSCRFDAVTCLSSSILHMVDDVQVLSALRSMRGVLADSGIVVLSQGTSDKQWREKPRFILALDDPDLTRLFVIDYQGNGARHNIVDIVRSGDLPRVEAWGVDYRNMLLQDDYNRLLRESGFRGIWWYGDYSGAPYDPVRSDGLIIVAMP